MVAHRQLTGMFVSFTVLLIPSGFLLGTLGYALGLILLAVAALTAGAGWLSLGAPISRKPIQKLKR